MSVRVSHELPSSQEGLVLALLLPAHCPKDSLGECPTSDEHWEKRPSLHPKSALKPQL